jgi:predicted PurR-regulated permease PerM
MDLPDPARPSLSPEAPRSQATARLALAAVLVAAGVWTLHHYLPALAWAAVFAIALWPLYTRAQRRWPPGRHDVLLPAAFTAAIALVFIVPLALAAVQAGREAGAVAAWVRETQAAGAAVPQWVPRLPLVGARAATWWQENLGEAQGPSALVRRLDQGGRAMTVGRTFGEALLHRAVLFGFTLLTLFFLFRDGAAVRDQMLAASRRAFGPAGERIGRQVIASVRGTVDGLVLVGLGEGALLGVAYAVAGDPHPVLLGALTAVAAMVPFGAALAFGLAALLLVIKGTVVAAGVVVALGFLVSFAADHAIRPALIGGTTRLPFLWVLLGILGGVETWGLLGLFLGPAIMAALILLWREWTEDATPG